MKHQRSILWVTAVFSLAACGDEATLSMGGSDKDESALGPAVTWTVPVQGATVQGLLNEVNANCRVATNPTTGIRKVEFYLDGVLLNSESSAPWSCAWDTATATPGSSHQLKAKAYDTSGYTGEAIVTVKIYDPNPHVTWTAPVEGATVKGVLNEANANCRVNVTAQNVVSKVEFYLDGVLLNSESTAPWSCAWDTATATPGSSHQLKARAYDTSGRYGEAAVNVKIASKPTQRILGGFGAYSSSAMSAVKNIGLNSVMDYVNISSGLNTAHNTLTTYSNQAASLGVKMIDDIPQQLIDRYHRDWNLTNLVNDMTTHVKWLAANPSVKSNIVAYWIIDDWYEDFGTAKTALQKITALTHQYTPGIPTICGFTGNTSYGGTVDGYARFAQNFSPSGCDMVGVYLYPYGSGKVPMSNLANIMAALKKNGWDINATPLVGIPQSYGGANGYYVPTAAQVEAETKYFCQLGATHLLFYDFHTGTSAATSSTIQAGIKAGVADCKAIWGI